MARLTARIVQTVTAAGLRADGDGLYLQVTAAGARTWIFRLQIAGRRRDMGLGSARVVTLAEAPPRRRTRGAWWPTASTRSRIAASKRTADARSRTFRTVADAYITAHASAWRSAKHAAQWSATLSTYAYPVMGDLPVVEVTTAHVLEVLRPIWAAKPETASRVRGRIIEAVLDAARAEGLREGENPARWRGHLDAIMPAKGRVHRVTHHAALPYTEMSEFWQRLRMQDGLGARALMLAILTASRTQEVLGAEWGEVDRAARVWTVPAARMKRGPAHRVPLSAPALDLLGGLWAIRRGNLVFLPAGGPTGRSATWPWPWPCGGWRWTSRRTGSGRRSAPGLRSARRLPTRSPRRASPTSCPMR